MFGGQVTLNRMGYFASTTVPKVTPFDIPEGEAFVEIITSGTVYYADERGLRRTYDRGTMLWHTAGDQTISDLPPGGRFSAMAVVFNLRQPLRRPGHISRWAHLNTLDEFIANTLQWNLDARLDTVALAEYLYARLYWEFYTGLAIAAHHRHPLPLAKALTMLDGPEGALLELGTLAKYAGVSKSHLFALFRKHLKTTPHQYRQEALLRRAGALLVSSNEPVKEIARRCGYHSIASFYRVFRQTYGVTPVEYRSSHSPLHANDLIITRGRRISLPV